MSCKCMGGVGEKKTYVNISWSIESQFLKDPAS